MAEGGGGAGDDWGTSAEDGGLEAGGEDAGVAGSAEGVTTGRSDEAAGGLGVSDCEGATKEESNVLPVPLLDMVTAIATQSPGKGRQARQ